MAVKPVPDGYHTVVPYLIVPDADKQLEFLKQAFGAKVDHLTRRDDGAIMHGDVMIGDSHVMLSQANDRFPAMPTAIYLYVPDTDALYQAALAAGATSLMEPANQFYGDRNAGVRDSQGNSWWIGTHVEDVAPEEIERRMKASTSAHG
jgi:PhnB protein